MTSADNSEQKNQYLAIKTRKYIFILVCVALLIVTAVYSCSVSTGCSFYETFCILIDHIRGVELEFRSEAYWNDYYITQNIMPGVVMALIAGAGLSLAGAVMQNVMNNPLADAYTTGISSGACLGAVAAIVLGVSLGFTTGSSAIVVNAFIGALIPCLILSVIVKYVGNSPATIILIGTALSFFFNAFVTLLMVSTDTSKLQEAYLWQIGSVAGAKWEDIPLMLVLVVISSILIQFVTKKMNILSLGETTARSLGLNVAHFRMLCLVIISVLVASIISFTGIIGFIGLVAPHMVRSIIGGDNKFVVPGSMVLGALILVLADAVSRALYGIAGELPIGVIMSFIGAPIFLYLIVRKKSKMEVF